jgi:hypothetical protein
VSGGDSLTPLQWQIVETLATLDPPATLTGGAALGIHLGHRATRDVDLFFRGRRELGEAPGRAANRLIDVGLTVTHLQTEPAFHRLRADGGVDTCVVDLVADPVPAVSEPVTIVHGGISIRVDSRHEILVNKLCALLSRSELRDLVDVRALLAAGEDLGSALRDAPLKDGGFSPVVMAWVLRDWEPAGLANSVGWSEAEARGIAAFHAELMARITALAAPE